LRIKNTLGISVLILILILGCASSARRFETIKTHSDDEQKSILERIKKNKADFDIYRCGALSVFSIKNDDKTLEIRNETCRLFVQQTPHDFVEIYAGTGIRSIAGPDGQVFGYITWDFQRTIVRAERVDENTIRIVNYRKPGGAPGRR
jgi:hypothetical protein